MTESSDDEVGYKKPPKKHQWKKGRSGNIKGRPPKNAAAEERTRALLLGPAEVRQDGKAIQMDVFEFRLRSLVTRASKGEWRAGVAFLDVCIKYGVLKPEPAPRRGGVIVVPVSYTDYVPRRPVILDGPDSEDT